MASTSEEEGKTTAITDGSPNAGWKAAKGEKAAMLEIDLEAPVAIQTLALAEPWHPWSGVTQKHELQYLVGTEWKTIFTGQTDGTGLTKNFPAVKAQKFRLLLENKNFPPAVNELILFRAE
jgi:hypothetical protein